MSRLRLQKKDLQKTPVVGQTPPRSAYNLFPSSPHSGLPTKRNAKPIVYLPDGKTLSQRLHLPIPRGQVGFLERPNDGTGMTPRGVSPAPREVHDIFEADRNAFIPPSPHSRKRLAQSARWENEVIRRLIAPYMKYARDSSNLAEELSEDALECVCLKKGLELEVVVVRFNSTWLLNIVTIRSFIARIPLELQRITLQTCSCQPAATQLMMRGLFGCAPVRPSLAVDLRVLDFVTRLFLRISPNNTAVCNTIDDFLKCQGYHLSGQVCLLDYHPGSSVLILL